MIAPGELLSESHRHHSCYLAIYPLGLMDPTYGTADSVLIDRSLRWLRQLGTRQWTGYSFAWSAALNARYHQGEKAADDLKKFATNFCSVNSFHLNGDQRGGQYSDLTYGPFTLEGNFAFAAAVQEMLLQSNTGVIELFPAVPAEWQDISFKNLRAQGAFLISAEMKDGTVSLIKIRAEKDGWMKMKMPSGGRFFTDMPVEGVIEEGILRIKMDAGEEVVLSREE